MYPYPPREEPGRLLVASNTIFPYPARVYATAPPVVEDLDARSVRIRVPFFEPPESDPRPVGETGRWSSLNNLYFDTFFTFPVRQLANPDATLRHLVIMFNGLNEILPWHSQLYDSLGHALAEQDVASILLPTPYHLNRTPQGNGPSGKVSDLLKKPTDSINYHAPYKNFVQSFHEVDRIIDAVHGSAHNHMFSGVYAKFGAETKISLFGFSMGGMRALAKFLIHDSDDLHRCILLSSGSRLGDLSPPDVGKEEWQNFARQIEHQMRPHRAKEFGLDTRIVDQLDAICHHDNFGPLSGKFEARGSGIRAILGGKDEKVAEEAIRRLGHRANIETVFGMTHRVVSDPYFEANFQRIVDGITLFLDADVDQLAMTKHEIRHEMIKFLKGQEVDPSKLETEFHSLVSVNPELRRLYLASKARFQSDAALLDYLLHEWDT